MLIVNVCSPRAPAPLGAIVVYTTSQAANWGRGLSPFVLGPVELWGGYEACNVENAWQYSKVYPQHVGKNGEPSDIWWTWAKQGWSKPHAVRYPMGKGAVPLYSWWDGKKLDYIEARKRIYCPLYAGAVEGTQAYKQLEWRAKRVRKIWLWDFDGYDYRKLDMSLKDVLNDPTRKMGHAFVLAMMLIGKRHWEET